MNLFCWFSFHNGKEQVWKAILRWGPIQTALTCSNFSEFKYKSTFDPFQGLLGQGLQTTCQRSPLFHKQLWSVTFWGKLAVMKSDHLRFLSHKIEVWARLTVSSRTTYQSRICETYVIYVYPVSRTTTVPTQFWLVDHYLSCSLSESGTMTFYCGLLPSSWISENKLKLESISCVTDSWNANILHLALQGVSVLWPPWLGVRSFPFKGGGIRLEMTAPAVIQWTGSVHISQEFPWLSSSSHLPPPYPSPPPPPSTDPLFPRWTGCHTEEDLHKVGEQALEKGEKS